MITLIIQNSFEPYYRGKKSFTAPASEPEIEPVEPGEASRSLQMKRQRVQLLQARLAAVKPRSEKP